MHCVLCIKILFVVIQNHIGWMPGDNPDLSHAEFEQKQLQLCSIHAAEQSVILCILFIVNITNNLTDFQVLFKAWGIYFQVKVILSQQ